MTVLQRPAHGGPQSLFYATAITEGSAGMGAPLEGMTPRTQR